MTAQEILRMYFITVILCTAFSLCCATVTSSKDSPDSSIIPDEKRLADFKAWILRVGEKSRIPRVKDSAFVAAAAGTGPVITVGSSNASFTSVQDAVDAVPSGNSQRYTIQIGAGVYKEKVYVPPSKPYILFQGAGSGLTIITYGDTEESAGTLQASATVAVDANGFVARDLTIQNSAPNPPEGTDGGQGVALRISGDQAAFYDCSFVGAQDTLFDDQGRHYFETCYIEGSVDFICGDGQSLYKGCQLHGISTGSVAAQRRMSPGESTGFSFVDCSVTGAGMLYLGRAWGDYSRVVYSTSFLGSAVNPLGWNNFGVPSREKTVFFGQYLCTGPGASTTDRVYWSYDLTAAQAAPFQTISFIDGESWL